MILTVVPPSNVCQQDSLRGTAIAVSPKSMMRFVAVVLFCVACFSASRLSAQQHEAATKVKGDGICDSFDGLAFAFCVAMCEARECDQRPVYDERCATLRNGFERVTGGQSAPCEAGSALEATLDRL